MKVLMNSIANENGSYVNLSKTKIVLETEVFKTRREIDFGQ